jgi:hypothetical protein
VGRIGRRAAVWTPGLSWCVADGDWPGGTGVGMRAGRAGMGQPDRPPKAAAIGAAVVSYEHAYSLVHAHGETGRSARLIPLTVDGLIWVSSMVMLDSARRGCAWRCLRDGCSAWASRPRSRRTSRTAWHARAAEEFADDVAAGCTPLIRATLHVGRPRAQRVRGYLDPAGQLAGPGGKLSGLRGRPRGVTVRRIVNVCTVAGDAISACAATWCVTGPGTTRW